jgi:hypothetical protein
LVKFLISLKFIVFYYLFYKIKIEFFHKQLFLDHN